MERLKVHIMPLESWDKGPLNKLPEPEQPYEKRGDFELKTTTTPAYKPMLAAFPNPASDHTFITYPADADGIGALNVYDGLGQMIASHNLKHNGIFELVTRNLAPGMYLLSIVVEGKPIVESRLVVTE